MTSTWRGGGGGGVKIHLKLRTVVDTWSGGALTLKSGRPQKNKIII